MTALSDRPGRRRSAGSLGGQLLSRPLRPMGSLFAVALDTVRAMPRRPFQWHESIDVHQPSPLTSTPAKRCR